MVLWASSYEATAGWEDRSAVMTAVNMALIAANTPDRDGQNERDINQLSFVNISRMCQIYIFAAA